MISRSRRRVLTATVLGLVAPPFGARAANEPEPLTAALLELVRDEHAARYLGRRYLAARRDAPARRALALEIVAARHQAQWIGASVAERRRLLAEHIANDFAAGRVVEVHGWLLAEAEAKLCALAALPPA